MAGPIPIDQAPNAIHTLTRTGPLARELVESTELFSPNGAEALRLQLAKLWPETQWNVLVELQAGGHYYYSEEQFNFELQAPADSSGDADGSPQQIWYYKYGASVAIFDRRCATLEREERAAAKDAQSDEFLEERQQ